MLSNATYISDELASLGLPESFTRSVEDVCSSLVGTKHDVISELHELEEFCAQPASEVVQRRVERILRWLGEEPPKLHKLIESLDSERERQPGLTGGYILVAESAVNVLRSFARASKDADAYFQAVPADTGA